MNLFILGVRVSSYLAPTVDVACYTAILCHFFNSCKVNARRRRPNGPTLQVEMVKGNVNNQPQVFVRLTKVQKILKYFTMNEQCSNSKFND